jgi:outer membrane protein
MKTRLLAVSMTLTLAAASHVLAQSASTQKIGIVNYLRTLVECAEGKGANADFQKKLELKKAELQRKQTEIQTLQQQLEAQKQTLNEETQAALAKNITVKNTELQRASEDAQKEFDGLRNDILERIGKKMAPLVEKYAQENKYTLVLDSSNQASQVLYLNAAIDFTDEIIKRYDAVNKVAAPASPAAAPAASGTK